MNDSVRFAHIPGPPFEPTSLLLDGRIGWPAASTAWERVEPGVDGVLRLAVDDKAARRLDEDNGSFGGLVPPRNVGLAPDGTVYLLDTPAHRLLRFDPCACSFVVVACIGGEGGGAREWRAPAGIAVGAGRLYVCDAGREAAPAGDCTDAAALERKLRRENHRVSVFSLNGLALLGHIERPAGLPAWQPVAVALGGHGRAYVADAVNGLVHVFSPALAHVRSLTGFHGARAIAVDRRGMLYVLCEEPQPSGGGAPGGAKKPFAFAVRTCDAEGRPLPTPRRVSDAAPWFPALPFAVDAQGRLDLRGLCADERPASAVFDGRGQAVLPEPEPVPERLFVRGSVLFGPLDSRLRACVWHRLLLQGQLPQGTRATVATYTAEEAIPADQLDDFARWETNQTAHVFEDGRWDCLVRSGAGRYLWLRLTLEGNGLATPAIAAVEIDFPRIGSRQYLPAVFGAEANSVDFTDRFLALFDTTLRGIERAVDVSPGLFDPKSAPAAPVGEAPIDFLSWLASWIGLRFDAGWDEAARRAFLAGAGRCLDQRGTLGGLRAALVQSLGLERGAACACPDEPTVRCSRRPANCAPPAPRPSVWQPPPLVLEHFRVRRWLFLGHGRIGERSMLWGRRIVNRSQLDGNAQADVTQLLSHPDPVRDPFHTHAHQFTVFVPACVRDDEARRRALEILIAAESPAHTRGYLEYVEPRFRIGVQSTLGFDAVIAALPKAMVLGEGALGGGVVAPPAREAAGGRSLELGPRSRAGVSSRIN